MPIPARDQRIAMLETIACELTSTGNYGASRVTDDSGVLIEDLLGNKIVVVPFYAPKHNSEFLNGLKTITRYENQEHDKDRCYFAPVFYKDGDNFFKPLSTISNNPVKKKGKIVPRKVAQGRSNSLRLYKPDEKARMVSLTDVELKVAKELPQLRLDNRTLPVLSYFRPADLVSPGEIEMYSLKGVTINNDYVEQGRSPAHRWRISEKIAKPQDATLGLVTCNGTQYARFAYK
jgi:hypothetical protein